MRIGFVGLGKLGMPCAEAMVQAGHTVVGYDVVELSSSIINIVQTIADCVADTEIVFLAVPTPHDPQYGGELPTSDLPPKDFDYTIVKQCLTKLNRHMTGQQILVLISTVLPGTIREELEPLVTNPQFIYNPYLIAMGSVAHDMINPEMVIIGTETGSMTDAALNVISFYTTMMQNDPRYVVGTWEEAECIKCFYNTFISTKIGLVNMIQDVAQGIGNINVDVVTQALADSTMRIMGPQYMKAGMGDGGGCHPRDAIALRYLAEQLDLGYDLFGSIMVARECQAEALALTLVRECLTTGYGIVIHGKAYKPGVSYTDGSYSLLVGHYCAQYNIDPIYVDPLTGDTDAPSGPAVFLLAHSATTTYRYSGHPMTDDLYCSIPPDSVVVDPWRSFVTNDPTVRVVHYGNTRNFG